MLDQDKRFPFQIDATGLEFLGSPNCLGKLIGRIMLEARLVQDRPKATKVGIALRAFSSPVGPNGYALVRARCHYVTGDVKTGVRDIFVAYYPDADSIFEGGGEHLDAVIAEVEAGNP
jgi:hypothetical protein